MLALLMVPLLHPFGQARMLNIFAAASLKEAFTSLAHVYESKVPGVTVKLNFAGSQTLAAQINQGAPADIFASASAKNLKEVDYDKSSYHVFALNKLDVGLRRGVTGIASLGDLDKVKNLVVADPSVPAGAYTEAFLKSAAKKYGSRWLDTLHSHIVSREADVKAVLAKVNLGEADAGIVYVSDIRANKGQAIELPIPDAFNQIAEYPAAVTSHASSPAEARRFIKFLLEPGSQHLLVLGGFLSVTRPPSRKRG